MAMDFPASPTVGQIVALGGNQYIWDGTAWNILPQQAPAQATDLPPANPAVGQFWWRATNGQLYVYVDDGDSKQWVQAAGQAATPGAWEFIKSVTLGAITFYDFLDLGAYQFVEFISSFRGTGVTSSLNGRVSSNNGVSFDSGASDYAVQAMTATAASVSAAATNTSFMQLSSGAGITNITHRLLLTDFNKASGMSYLYHSAGTDGGAQAHVSQGGGVRGSAVPRNAFRFLNASGNLTGTTILAQGVRG